MLLHVCLRMYSFRVKGWATYFHLSFYPMGSFVLRVKDDPNIPTTMTLIVVFCNVFITIISVYYKCISGITLHVSNTRCTYFRVKKRLSIFSNTLVNT